MLQGAAALEGWGSGSSFWMLLFHAGCLKPFLELGLKLEENFSSVTPFHGEAWAEREDSPIESCW